MDRTIESQGKKSLHQIVAEKVEREVKRAGGQVAFAMRTGGLGQSTVSRVLNFRQDVTLEVLEKLAKGCRVQPYEMLIDSETMRRAVVERFLQPSDPEPAAAVSGSLPKRRRGEGEGPIAVDDAALRSVRETKTPPTARAEEFPARRKGARRAKKKRL